MSDAADSPIDQPAPVPSFEVGSHSWVGELDRFDRLFEAGFGTSETIFAAIDRLEQMIAPPTVVDEALQRIAMGYCDGLKPEAVEMFGNLYYTCMRAGYSAAEAVLVLRGATVGDLDQATFDERFIAITRAWTELDPWAQLSDFAYYLLDDLAPSVQQHVAEVMRQAVPNHELPDGWEMIPPLRQPLDRAMNGVMVAAAAALAAFGQSAL